MTTDMFPGTKPPRKKRRVMAHVIDGGADYIRFQCKKCRWDSGWLIDDSTMTEALRGIPCEVCNKNEV